MGFCFFSNAAIAGALRARQARRRARRRRRFRRPPRQRHAGHLLVRQGPVLRLDAPDAALSRARGRSARPASATSGTRRSGPATAARDSARRSRGASSGPLHNFATRPRHHLGRLRRAQARPARRARAGRSRFHVGNRGDRQDRRPSMPTGASCRCSKAATISRRSPSRSASTSAR